MKKLVSVLCSVVFIPAMVFAADNPLSSHTASQVLDVSPSASSNSYQTARLYFLPDYQEKQLNNSNNRNFNNRTQNDNSNRNKGCGSELVSPKSASEGWSCSKVVVNHRICYHCTPVGCPSGYSTDKSTQASCGVASGAGWNHSTSGKSGGTVCGKCTIKDANSCSGKVSDVKNCGTAGGWSLDKTASPCYIGDTPYYPCKKNTCDTSKYKTSVSQCGTQGAKGWTLNTSAGKNCYAGDTLYGTCEKLSCNTGYTSGISSCTPSNGYAYYSDTNRSNGDAVCGKCVANDCSGKVTKVADCGSTGSSGWTISSSPSCYSGSTAYYTCTAKSCPNGYDIKTNFCAEQTGYTVTLTTSSTYNGNSACKKCVIQANSCSGTPKTDCNTANGYTFTPNGCNSAGVEYGTCKANTCSGTAQSACTSSDYTFTPSGCMSAGVEYGTCTKKSCEGVTNVEECGTNGSLGWIWYSNNCVLDNKPYGTCKPKPCTAGSTGQTCTGGNVWVKNGFYSGEAPCGSCAPLTCTAEPHATAYRPFRKMNGDYVSLPDNIPTFFAGGICRQLFGASPAQDKYEGECSDGSAFITNYCNVGTETYSLNCDMCTTICNDYVQLSEFDYVTPKNGTSITAEHKQKMFDADLATCKKICSAACGGSEGEDINFCPSDFKAINGEVSTAGFNFAGGYNTDYPLSFSVDYGPAFYYSGICSAVFYNTKTPTQRQDHCGHTVYQCNNVSLLESAGNKPLTQCISDCDVAVNDVSYDEGFMKVHDQTSCYSVCNKLYSITYYQQSTSTFYCPNAIKANSGSTNYSRGCCGSNEAEYSYDEGDRISFGCSSAVGSDPHCEITYSCGSPQPY